MTNDTAPTPIAPQNGAGAAYGHVDIAHERLWWERTRERLNIPERERLAALLDALAAAQEREREALDELCGSEAAHLDTLKALGEVREMAAFHRAEMGEAMLIIEQQDRNLARLDAIGRRVVKAWREAEAERETLRAMYEERRQRASELSRELAQAQVLAQAWYRQAKEGERRRIAEAAWRGPYRVGVVDEASGLHYAGATFTHEVYDASGDPCEPIASCDTPEQAARLVALLNRYEATVRETWQRREGERE